MVRSYDVPAAKNYYENADSVVSRIYAMSMDPENYLKGNLMVNYDDPNNHIISMEFDTYDQNLEYGSINIPDERAQEIYDAYLKDIRAGHIYLNTVMITTINIRISMDCICMSITARESSLPEGNNGCGEWKTVKIIISI